MNGVVVGVFTFLFLLVTVMGFAAARWRRAESLDHLDEWGLGGRSFGTFIAWFLIGGDIYTAYTFIAVPATLYAGSVVGFFAVPYTIVVYPLIFLFLPKLRDARGLRGGPLRLQAAGAGGRDHRHPRDDALHRAAAGGHAGGARGDGHRRGGRELVHPGPPAVHRVRRARGVHLLLGPAGAGADRVRQGHADLPRHHRRGHLPALAGRRLGQHLLRGQRQLRRVQHRERGRDRGRGGPAEGHDPAARGALGVRLAGPRCPPAAAR